MIKVKIFLFIFLFAITAFCREQNAVELITKEEEVNMIEFVCDLGGEYGGR